MDPNGDGARSIMPPRPSAFVRLHNELWMYHKRSGLGPTIRNAFDGEFFTIAPRRPAMLRWDKPESYFGRHGNGGTPYGPLPWRHVPNATPNAAQTTDISIRGHHISLCGVFPDGALQVYCSLPPSHRLHRVQRTWWP